MIRLSRIADYGIVVMTHMARQADRRLSAPELAAATRVPVPTTSKILKLLARHGIVVSHRGVRGGYGLARPASQINIAQLIEALDGPIAVTSCVDGGEHDCDIQRLCVARTSWQRINDAIRTALDDITLAEMAQAIPPAFMASVARSETGAPASPPGGL